MPLIPALVAGGASLAGTVIGANAQSDARQQAYDLIQQSIQDLQAIGVPSAQAQEIVLQKYQSAGQLTPELEQAVRQGDSGLGDISTDERTKEAQMNALTELQGIGEGGVRLSDKATENKLMGDIEARSRGARGAIVQNQREKSQYGGGAELANLLQNQQDEATQSNAVGTNLNAQAQDRALQAIVESGKLGGQMQSTEFEQKAKQKAAQDAINQFNTQNQQGVVARNAAAKNTAQASNLANAQQISNANTGVTNQQEVYNKGLKEKEYQDRLQKATLAANARSGQASNVVAGGQNEANLAAGAGNAIGQTVLAGANAAQKTATADADRDSYDERTKAMYGGA